MNRKERRAAKSQHKSNKLERVVAIHEAGHAVARVLVADDFSRPAQEMISHIDVGTRQALGGSISDEKVTLVSQAVTFGATLSTELQDLFDRSVEGAPADKLTKQHIVDAIAQAPRVDVERWLRARMLISVLASAAEAKFSDLPVMDVWNSLQSEGDLKGSVEDGIYAGLPPNEIAAYIDEAMERASNLIDEAPVQRAIEALADALPAAGRLSGRRAVFIITRALTS